MARVTIEDCLKRVENMYELVHLATRRARQLYKGSEPLVKSKNRVIVTALREIASGRVSAVTEKASNPNDDMPPHVELKKEFTMTQAVMFDLEQNRSRLSYYTQLKAKAGTPKTPLVDKWIEIYSDRVAKLERQATKLGLKTKLENAASASSSKRA